jgi:bifunctional DNase/RNase
MKRQRWIVGVGLLAVAVSGVGAAKEQAPPGRPSLAGPQEAEVVNVVVDPRSQQPLIVLQGKRDKRQLAMAVGFFEAERIAIPLQGVTPPRPLTHDLFVTLFGRLKVTLRRVVITDLRESTYYAVLYLDAGGAEVTLDSRPSDAIALALRAKVPILVEDQVFDKSAAPGASPTPHF